MRSRLLLLALFLLSLAARAQQYTTVSATIVDPNGKAYAGGTWTATLNTGVDRATFVGDGAVTPQYYSGILSGGGSFTQRLWSAAGITPANTTWTIAFCDSTGQYCASVVATINGATQDLSAVLSAAAKALPGPNPNFPPSAVITVAAAPSGSCPQGAPGNLVNSTGQLWTCQNITAGTGTWGQATAGGAGSTFNVVGYGATCGSGDSTAAVQSATSAAIAASGTVLFPCVVTITQASNLSDHLIAMSGGSVTFEGQGIGGVKVADSTGDYQSIFGTNGGAYSNVTFSNLIVNANTTGNPTTSNTGTYRRTIFYASSGSNNRVLNSQLIDLATANAFSLHTDHTVIDNNIFSVNTSGSTYWFDSSIVYTTNDDVSITNNHFLCAINKAGCVAAIETHSGNTVIQGNHAVGFYQFMNVTGVAITDSVLINVSNNVGKDLYNGIRLISETYSSHNSGYGLHNVIAANNNIKIANASWTTKPSNGGALTGYPRGIYTDGSTNLPIESMSWTGNLVEYDGYDAQSGSETTYVTGGQAFGLMDVNGTTVTHFVFDGNTAINPTGACFWNAATTPNAVIKNNHLFNCGSAKSATVTSAYRAGIYEYNPSNALTQYMENNDIHDDLSTTQMVYGYNLSGTTGSVLNIKGGTVSITGGTTTNYVGPVYAGSGSTILIDGLTQNALALTTAMFPSNAVVAGSTFKDGTNASAWTAKSGGTTWFNVSYGTAVPISGAHNVGDTVWNTAPAGSGVAGWTCVSAGTPGTWNQLPIIPVGAALAQTANVQVPSSDCISAHAGDTSVTFIGGATSCPNVTDPISGGTIATFATNYPVSANYFTSAGKQLLIRADFAIWTPTTAPTLTLRLYNGSTLAVNPQQTMALGNAITKYLASVTFQETATAAADGHVISDYTAIVMPSSTAGTVNATAQPTAPGTGSYNAQVELFFSATGLSTTTYSSGGSFSGTGSCTIDTFTPTCTGASGTIAVSGGTPGAITITNTGYACTSVTGATVHSGTATCSGTPTLTGSTFGGAQGTAIQLVGLSVQPVN